MSSPQVRIRPPLAHDLEHRDEDGAATARRRPRGEYRGDIEGLRAVAVLLVVLFHASIGPFSGGFVGVDVFFVLSGFLITGLLLREIENTGRISLVAFYARRVRRLLPAAILVLLVTLLASIVVLPPLLVPTVAGDVASAALYVSNVGFAVRATDYFAAGQAPSPILHYWSLGVEEQFYLLWPAILLLVAAKSRRPRRRAAIAVLAISVVSFGFSLWLTSVDAPWAFFSLPTRAWELGLGAILAVAGQRLSAIPARLAAAIGWLGLGLIVLSGLILDDATPFPGLAALLPTVGATLVVAAGSRATVMGPGRLLATAVPRFFGRISYSLYLWHWPLLVLPAAALGAPLAPWQGAGLMVVAIVLSALTQRFVEDPLRRGRIVGARPRLNLATAGAAAVVVALVATSAGASATAALPGTTTTANAAANEQSLDSILNSLEGAPPPAASSPGASGSVGPGPTASTAAARATPVRPRTVDRPVPSNIQPALWAAAQDYPLAYVDGCHTQEDGGANRGSCLYGNLGSATTIALFGDSHALAWFPAVQRIAVEKGWRLLDLTMSTCSPAILSLWNSNYRRVSTECSAWRERAMQRLVGLRPSIILVTGTRGIEPVDATGHILTGAARIPLWMSGMKRTLARLLPAAGKVILLADTPLSRVDPPACLSQHLASILACTTPVSVAIDPAWLRAERQVAADSGVGFIDPEFWVCPTSPCPTVIGNILVFRDPGHMSTVFSAALAGRLGDAIEAVIQRRSAGFMGIGQ